MLLLKRHTIPLSFLLCVLLVLVPGCSKNGDDGTPAPPEPGVALNEWKFTADNKDYKGSIRSANFIPGIGIYMEGLVGNSQDSLISILLGFTNQNIVTGNCSTGPSPQTSAFNVSEPNTPSIYVANPNTASSAVLNFQITGYDTLTRELKGLFSGKVLNKNVTSVAVSNGGFRATID